MRAVQIYTSPVLKSRCRNSGMIAQRRKVIPPETRVSDEPRATTECNQRGTGNHREMVPEITEIISGSWKLRCKPGSSPGDGDGGPIFDRPEEAYGVWYEHNSDITLQRW